MSSPRMAKAATPMPTPMPAAAPVLSPCVDEVGVGAALVPALVLALDGEVVVVVATVEVDGAEV